MLPLFVLPGGVRICSRGPLVHAQLSLLRRGIQHSTAGEGIDRCPQREATREGPPYSVCCALNLNALQQRRPARVLHRGHWQAVGDLLRRELARAETEVHKSEEIRTGVLGHHSKAHWFSRRTCSSSSGEKSFCTKTPQKIMRYFDQVCF